MAATKVVVDPITRIEGHLRIEVQAENGRITNAWASSTQFRGIEIVMEGRDPRDAWAFTQRICGVCTVVHAVASCRAVEDALGITIPPNAQLIRNLIHGMQFIQDHVIHFYHLHALDWVDVVSALRADPEGTARLARSISPWPNNSATYFAEVQNRVKQFVASGQLGIFTNGYWGHPAYKLPPEANLMAVAHYLEALDWQRDIIRLHTIFGGKNPHPNFLVGGMASAINLDDTATINAERLTDIRDMITRAQRFVEQVYWPDLVAIAGFYKEWGAIGGGTPHFLAVGEFPEGDIKDLDKLYLPRGIILDQDLSRVHPYDEAKVLEYITSSWYEYSKGDAAGLHPYEGETKARYTGPPPPWEYLQGLPKYSWMKAPRYDGRPMQVGPLARMLVAFASGHEEAREIVKQVLDTLQVGPAALFSTLGRTAARGMETVLLARRMNTWYSRLVDRIKSGDTRTFAGEKWSPDTWPRECQGYGWLDAPRGALGHWVKIRNGKIARYQCVVPSTWNCSPRDGQGQMGPYEAALVDRHPLVRPDQPLEILRTIHSFDPCMACGVHVLDASGNLVTEVKVQ
ncbi:MAG TPA: nickel-dependent hydrogenase large subunit [Gemmatimonadales bacterium]|jgi:[NiFe] hydrogenase large subunit/hydrogenase large subunit|nr:nickel-dependent hydrogenase large subunit [Gemmatimonadales bacterium]